ncbi:MAG: GLUG motif-containing protein [archaeon]
MSNKMSGAKAQGTIEYLVILAVIVVISLVVVGLATNVVGSPSTQINSSTEKVGSLTSGGITVVESVTDSQGDSIIRLQNNSGENLTLNKVSVGDNETIFNEQLVSGDAKSFSLSDLDLSCPCSEGQEKVSCSFIFYLTTQNGLSKKQTITTTTQCTPVTTPVDPTKVVGLGTGTVADPFKIKSCREIQNINQNPYDNFILATDINCTETKTWNSGAGFIPIGTTSSCTDVACADETSCELPVGCASTWYSTTGCSEDFDPSCSDETTCTGYCMGLWFEENTCANPTCATQESCIRAVGCGSTWNHTAFTGSLNGNNHTINNLFIYDTSDEVQVGLFNYTNGATIQNLGLVDVNITGRTVTGSLAAYQEGGLISNSYSTGNVTGDMSVTSNFIGGLVGQSNNATIRNSYSTAKVDGWVVVGGLVGHAEGSLIDNSYTLGTVTGLQRVGGLVGSAYSSTINHSYSSKNVTGNVYVGGLVGYNYNSPMNNSFSTGIITGSAPVGGLAGILSSGTITNSYWYNVVGDSATNCYSAGNTGCTAKTDLSWFYTTTNAPMSTWTFGTDGNWVARDGNYPILSWQ